MTILMLIIWLHSQYLFFWVIFRVLPCHHLDDAVGVCLRLHLGEPQNIYKKINLNFTPHFYNTLCQTKLFIELIVELFFILAHSMLLSFNGVCVLLGLWRGRSTTTLDPCTSHHHYTAINRTEHVYSWQLNCNCTETIKATTSSMTLKHEIAPLLVT